MILFACKESQRDRDIRQITSLHRHLHHHHLPILRFLLRPRTLEDVADEEIADVSELPNEEAKLAPLKLPRVEPE